MMSNSSSETIKRKGANAVFLQSGNQEYCLTLERTRNTDAKIKYLCLQSIKQKTVKIMLRRKVEALQIVLLFHEVYLKLVNQGISAEA